MTSGKWKITSFSNNGTHKTSVFSGYEFQSFNNNTVDARKNSVLEKMRPGVGIPLIKP